MEKSKVALRTVVVIEDNPDIAKILAKKLEDKEYKAVLIRNGYDALSYIKNTKAPYAVILDLMIPQRSGFELLGIIKSVWPYARLIIYSAHPEYKSMIPAECADHFFLKTVSVDEVLGVI